MPFFLMTYAQCTVGQQGMLTLSYTNVYKIRKQGIWFNMAAFKHIQCNIRTCIKNIPTNILQVDRLPPNLEKTRLSKINFHCADRKSSPKKLRMKMCRKGNKTKKKCIKIIKKGYFYSFAFKSKNFAKVVGNFAQTCVCVSAAFRNSGKDKCSTKF